MQKTVLMQRRLSVIASCLLIAFNSHASEDQIERDNLSVILANTYEQGIDISQYWQSEKLDGVRAIWNGKTLTTRNGRLIVAPSWFTQPLPNVPLEGELWAGRGNFHIVQQTVLDHKPVDQAWKKIDFMLFDMPHAEGDYKKRYLGITQLVAKLEAKHIHYIEHTPIESEHGLFRYLEIGRAHV